MAELNQITYKPNKWVNDSAPDLEADTLNNIESGIIQATELLNGLVTEYKNLVSKKMIVNDFLSTNSETVLSGPMGKLLNEKYEQLNRDFGDTKITDNVYNSVLAGGATSVYGKTIEMTKGTDSYYLTVNAEKELLVGFRNNPNEANIWKKYVSTSDLTSGTVTLGVINPNSFSEITVTFKTPMPNNNYDVTATQYTAPDSSDRVTLYTSNYTTNGFKLSGYNNGASATGNIKVCWIAVYSK